MLFLCSSPIPLHAHPSDQRPSGRLSSTLTRCQRHDRDGDRRALRSKWTIVKIVESTRETLVEDSGSTEGQASVAADAEAAGEDGAALRRLVELELEVGCNISSTSFAVDKNTAAECESEGVRGLASNHRDIFHAGRTGCLRLAVGNLADRSSSGSLKLSIRDLRYGRSCGSLRLAIRNL
jgi:hypothetical protein